MNPLCGNTYTHTYIWRTDSCYSLHTRRSPSADTTKKFRPCLTRALAAPRPFQMVCFHIHDHTHLLFLKTWTYSLGFPARKKKTEKYKERETIVVRRNTICHQHREASVVIYAAKNIFKNGPSLCCLGSKNRWPLTTTHDVLQK